MMFSAQICKVVTAKFYSLFTIHRRSLFISYRDQTMHEIGTTLTREEYGSSRGLTQFKNVTLVSYHLSNDPNIISPPTVQLQTAKSAMGRIAAVGYAEASMPHF